MTACFFKDADHGPCEGRLEWHHVLPKQRLKQEFRYGASHDADGFVPGTYRPAHRYMEGAPDELPVYISLASILGDGRNRIWICDRHHQLVTNARIYIPRSAMQSVEEFARDYGLEGWLDRYTKEAA